MNATTTLSAGLLASVSLFLGCKVLGLSAFLAKKSTLLLVRATVRSPNRVVKVGRFLTSPKTVWCPGKARSVALTWTILLPIFFIAFAYLGFYVLWKAIPPPTLWQTRDPQRSTSVGRSSCVWSRKSHSKGSHNDGFRVCYGHTRPSGAVLAQTNPGVGFREAEAWAH